MLPSADTVAGMLADPATRIATLDALDQTDGPHDVALGLAVAPALTDLLCQDGVAVPHELYQRVGLLRARLVVEAKDPVAMCGATRGGGRYSRELTAPSVCMGGLRSKSAGELSRDDALSLACGDALLWAVNDGHGYKGTMAAAGFGSPLDFVDIFMAEHPIVSVQRCPDDDKPTTMLTLLVELLRSGELPDLAIGGALLAVQFCISGRPTVARASVELGVFELVAAQLLRSGAPSDLLSTAYRPGKTGRGHLYGGFGAVSNTINGFGDSEARPDLDALVSSGLLDQLVSTLRAFEQSGVESLETTDKSGMVHVLGILRKAIIHPNVQALMRTTGSVIAFAMEHSLAWCEELGWTSGAYAAALCEDRSQCRLRCPHSNASYMFCANAS
eukprot:COSAG02_NODE_5468_length_4297_cov_3.717008_2_plen_388_part_00